MRCNIRFTDLRGVSAAAHPVVAVAVMACVAGGCASTGAVPRPFPQPGASTTARANAGPPGEVSDLISTALALQGTPYRNGGDNPRGFDCSGFTQYVFARHGVSLPRSTQSQFSAGASVRLDEVNAGDLLFFTTVTPGPSHVGIAVSSTTFVHAPSSRGVVRMERLSDSYWAKRFVGARRVR
jgi:cell wall-associated NlpC family hydrolase